VRVTARGAATLFIMVYAFSTGELVGTQLTLPGNMGIVAVVAALAYSVFFNISWGPVMWVMLGEMFPNQMRGSALAVAGLFQWLANFAISVSFPSMADGLGLVTTYGFYAVSALISYFLVKAWVHETRGRELEAMVG
jgi:SP family sugar:H+ symporter-like MFS transporter